MAQPFSLRVSARRRLRQLRLARRRQRRRVCATPSAGSRRISDELLARDRPATRSTFRPNYDGTHDRAGRAAGARSRTCSSTARPASPSAWRRTSRRTTSARSCTALITLLDNRGPRAARSCCRYIKGPDFPTGGQILNSPGGAAARSTRPGRASIRAARRRGSIEAGARAAARRSIITVDPVRGEQGARSSSASPTSCIGAQAAAAARRARTCRPTTCASRSR